MTSPPPPKINFAGMVGAKRRRMRSGGNVSTLSNNHHSPKHSGAGATLAEIEDEEEKLVQTSKCKGATTIPIFLKKTYKMIDSCDPSIACWTPDGEMFVVKNPDRFATSVIPQYFDHNKFSSFARQLNFYGFRKIQSKPIKNSDFDANTAKHVTFFNENFKRGHCELLKKIQRSTRGGTTTGQDQSREVQDLRAKVADLEKTISDMGDQVEERMRRLELDMLGRMEQMMLAMQQQGGQPRGNANGKMEVPKAPGSNPSINVGGGFGFDPLPFGARGASIGSLSGFASLAGSNVLGMNVGANDKGGPTLPPHPKQKSLPPQGLPGALTIPPARLETLRGISNLSRGLSIESTSSALLNGNGGWEDKFFSMLMSGEKPQVGASLGMNPTPMNPNILNMAMANGGSGMGGKMGI